jgi:predicted ester cyclase
MSTEDNKAVVRRFLDTFYRRDVAAFREVTAPDLAKVIEQWMPIQDGIWADRQLSITEMMAEGDRVWARLASSGRHIGEFRGLPPTGKPSTGAGIGFMRVSGGRVVEFSAIWDDIARLQQLGGVVVPGAQ